MSLHDGHPACGGDRRRRSAPAGFTLPELLVAMGILLAAILAVSQVFSISSEVAGRMTAHADLLEAAAGLRERMSLELARLAPDSLLVIDSPRATSARADLPNGPKVTRMRHDRLVFVANSPDASAFQSFTHRWATTPATADRAPPSSGQAIVYFGPTVPVQSDGAEVAFDDDSVGLSGTRWTYGHRATLLMTEIPANTDGNWLPLSTDAFETMLGGQPLAPTLRENRTDALIDSDPNSVEGAYLERFGAFIRNKSFADLLSPAPSIRALWEPHLTPVGFSLINTGDADFYTRSSATLRRGLADIRIEWTDGRRVNPTDPNPLNRNFNTRWFGLRPDPTQAPDPADPDTIVYFSARRQDVAGDSTVQESQTFANEIEWSAAGSASDANAAYRAIWRSDTWAHRPRAIRVTFRVYDSGNRLRDTSTVDLDEDGDADPDGVALPDYVVTRYGLEHSFVVAVP